MTDDADAAAEEPTEAETGVDAPEETDAETAPEADAGAEASAAEGEREQEELDRSLIERVADHDEALAEELEAERADYEERVDDLESKLTRKQADFQNFKKRQQKKLEQQRARATEDLVERLLPVRDNLARALAQDGDADIREGVEKTLGELDRVLDDEGVDRIEPEVGEEPDPERHEVLMRVESDRPAGVIDELYRPGYEMGDRVIRTAQVTVSQE
ncbi:MULTISPECIES: nucleotide exchange factor GrpE [Halolamina]|uniref:Protein GrpE n=1 Tax=Halolamina pelagica TaxID=699431 RepID=A0A1I5MY66_9EURY|nr:MULTISPECIES: nucleotide exchange factor GrpE [Halolamina]NHX36217.1 nucleotide exchange factor GrpE [Halolamina sp. R1-12]SFP14484.1 molecular chaperone GrpE [Halolamina pelagica]